VDGVRPIGADGDIDLGARVRLAAPMAVEADQLELPDVSAEAATRRRKGGVKGKCVLEGDRAIDKQRATRLAVVMAKVPFDEKRPIHIARKLDVVHSDPHGPLFLRRHEE
jgi:hypothetical protein